MHAQKLCEKEGFLLSCPVTENVNHLLYEYQLDVSLDNLPQGNIIQRYQSARDKKVVQKILNDNDYFLNTSGIFSYGGQAMDCVERKKDVFVSFNCITNVLQVNNKTVGFVNYFVRDLHCLTFYLMRLAAVNLIGVDKEYLRQGYGTLLLKHAISELEQLQAPQIRVQVKKDNVGARKLYEKQGLVSLIGCYYKMQMTL